MASQAIPQHTHCNMCGKSIPVGETLCSEECKQKFNKMVKRRRLIYYLMYGMLFIVLIILIFGTRV